MNNCNRYECHIKGYCNHKKLNNKWKRIGNMNFGHRKTIGDMRPTGKE